MIENYRVTRAPDGEIALDLISDLEVAMWQSGLMTKIEESRAHPEHMIPLDVNL